MRRIATLSNFSFNLSPDLLRRQAFLLLVALDWMARTSYDASSRQGMQGKDPLDWTWRPARINPRCFAPTIGNKPQTPLKDRNRRWERVCVPGQQNQIVRRYRWKHQGESLKSKTCVELDDLHLHQHQNENIQIQHESHAVLEVRDMESHHHHFHQNLNLHQHLLYPANPTLALIGQDTRSRPVTRANKQPKDVDLSRRKLRWVGHTWGKKSRAQVESAANLAKNFIVQAESF